MGKEGEIQVQETRTHPDSAEQRMSEESSTGESQSESESEGEKQGKEIKRRTGTKGGRCSLRMSGANTPENETRQEGWEPPGRESDHADHGHTHKSSMPLARKGLTCEDEDLGKNTPDARGIKERTTTTFSTLRSHPADLREKLTRPPHSHPFTGDKVM